MSEHTEAHREVLYDLLDQEDPMASLEASALAGCSECRQTLADMQALRGDLDAAGQEQRELLADDASDAEAPGPDLVRRVIEEQVRTSAPGPLLPRWVAFSRSPYGIAAAFILCPSPCCNTASKMPRSASIHSLRARQVRFGDHIREENP